MRDEAQKLAADLQDVVRSIGDMVDVNADGSLTAVSAHIIASALARRGWEAESKGSVVYAWEVRESEYQPDTRRRYKIHLQPPRQGDGASTIVIALVPELEDINITVTLGP